MPLSCPPINSGIQSIPGTIDAVDGSKAPQVVARKYIAVDNAQTTMPEQEPVPLTNRTVTQHEGTPFFSNNHEDEGDALEGAADLPFSATMAAPDTSALPECATAHAGVTPPGTDSCLQGSTHYGDLLSHYGDRDFYPGQIITTFTTPAQILPSIGAAIAEGSVDAGFALRKRSKIKHRQHYVTASYNIKKQHQKDPAYYSAKPTSFQQFKDLMHLSFLIDTHGSDKKTSAVINLVNQHKHYQQADDIRHLMENLHTLFPDNEQLGNMTESINPAFIAEPGTLAILQKRLNKYGITIDYQKAGPWKQQCADKFRKRKNEKSCAILHRVIIDKKKLFQKLEKHNKLPGSDVIAITVDKKESVINTINELNDYDGWKLTYINRDTVIKITAITTGLLPIVPAYDLIRVGGFIKEKQYRSDNKANMTHRIVNSLKVLEEHKACFTDEQYHALSTCLNNIQEVKTRHIELKENKASAMQAIHVTSAVVAPFSDITGPIGSGSRSAIKGAAKIASSVYPMVQRYRGDKKQHEQHTFNRSMDAYKLYKALYLLADEQGKESLKKAIIMLAEHSFDLTPHEFDVLAGTELVESEQLKLSFCRPTGQRARVPSAEDNTLHTPEINKPIMV